MNRTTNKQKSDRHREIVEHIVKGFETKYAGKWSCVVGDLWWGCLYYRQGNYIRFNVDDMMISLFKGIDF